MKNPTAPQACINGKPTNLTSMTLRAEAMPRYWELRQQQPGMSIFEAATQANAELVAAEAKSAELKQATEVGK